MSWRPGVGLSALLLFLLPISATAQEAASSFDQLRASGLAKEGDTVDVTDASGARVKGRIADLGATSLVLLTGHSTRRDFSEMTVTKIQRRDSLANGILIGLGVGAALGVVSVNSLCNLPDPECAAIVTLAIALPSTAGGAILGAVVDGLIRKIVYIAPRPTHSVRLGLSLMQSRDRTGAAISVRF
jgi:hypothetical protein